MTAIAWNLPALHSFINSPTGGVARDLSRRAVAVESRAKTLLNDSFPPPSSPGEPPHKRSARLQTSITWALGEDSLGVYAEVGTNVEYAIYLELGTDRMAARPFLEPALSAARI